MEEELEAINAVYGEDSVTVSRNMQTMNPTVLVRVDELCFHCELPNNYPASTAPIVLNGGFAQRELAEVFIQGEPVLLAWIEHVRETHRGGGQVQSTITPPVSATAPPPPPPPTKVSFVSTEPFVINKSKFIGHAAKCATKLQAMEMIQYVMFMNQKATHNMWAYRCGDGIEDNDDDGEDAAGKRLSLVLHSMQANNIAVVVTRYYGGIQLGPARFKYIMQCCREAVNLL